MSRMAWQTVLLVLALFLLLPSAASAQGQKPSTPRPAESESAKATKPPGKLSLQSVTLVNTAEAARQVAKEASAKAQETKAPSKGSKPAGAEKITDGAVLEFHPAQGGATDSGTGSFQIKDRKKSVLKNIHGSAYGAAASAAVKAHGEGGAVGADSGNGKVHVYVEGERARASTPAPH